MKDIWIIGAGKFGMKALGRLGRQYPEANITVVDKQTEGAIQFIPSCNRIRGDGIHFLSEHLTPDCPDVIVPAIPIHVAYEWIIARLQPDFLINPLFIPDDLLARLPNPIKGKNGAILVSYAQFICPDNCTEPEDCCTYTGKPRPMNLYDLLETLSDERFQSVVIRSRQMAPGVGGYGPKSLFRAIETVLSAKTPVLISTACRCHGIIHAVEILKQRVS